MNLSCVLIDVREPSEFAAGHAKGARNLPLSDLVAGNLDLESIPQDSKIIVYCRSGNRSAIAIEMLEKRGFTNLTNGIDAQQAQEYFTER